MHKRNVCRLLKRTPGYVWTLLAFLAGILLGGLFPNALAPVADATRSGLDGFIRLVPILIVVALSPAISKLLQMAKGARMAGSVLLWYLCTSSLAGLIGLMVSALLFDVDFSAGGGGIGSVLTMFSAMDGQVSASWPLLAILVAVAAGAAAPHIAPLDRLLALFDRGMQRSTPVLTALMPVIVFFLGTTLAINTGAGDSIRHYALMTLYTLGLCALWWTIYVFIVLRLVAKQPVRRLISEYYLPTAVFAAGSCSSLATLPVNLQNVRKYGVSESVSGFVIPIGAVINLDTSAMAYVAYAPFIMTVIYDLPVSWTAILVAWPAIVLFTVAAPGLPAGMGTALWSSTLFASLLGLGGEDQTTFITTWIALSGGLPDMLRTATNCTSDGFTAILFERFYGTRQGSPGPKGAPD